MAAEILAGIALPIAIYQTAEKFYECGRYIYQRIKTYRNAPQLVGEIQLFAESMYDGDVQVELDMTDWLMKQSNVNEALKTRTLSFFDQLATELVAIDHLLDYCFDDRGQLNATYFTLRGEKKLRKCKQRMESLTANFWSTVDIIQRMRTILPDPLALTSPSPFMPRAGDYGTPVGDSPYLRRGKAELEVNGKARNLAVLCEVLPNDASRGLAAIQSIARELAKTLYKPNKGILRCLGYRESPSVELVFEFPSGYESPRTLRSILTESTSLKTENRCSLDYRLQLAGEIQSAILSVHTAGFVHKNIRPDSIVLFSKQITAADDAKSTIDYTILSPAFLTEWNKLRDVKMLTPYAGDDLWHRNFYRHHERQGLMPQYRYELKHDVYSLGVCLLEIGLWESFIVSSANNEKKLSDFFLAAALEVPGVDETTFAHPNALCASTILQDILVHIASRLLPRTMGDAYTKLVIICLRNVEDGVGGQILGGDNITAALHFEELVLGSTPRLTTGEQ